MELGVPVAVIADQHQVILGHQIIWKGVDRDVIVPGIRSLQRDYPTLKRLSLDKGFWRPKIDADLSATLDQVTLPKTGRRTVAERTDDFVVARKPHPAIESAITMLERHGRQRAFPLAVKGSREWSAFPSLPPIWSAWDAISARPSEAERDRRKCQQRAASLVEKSVSN